MRCKRNARTKSVGSFWKTNPPGRVFRVASSGKWVCFRSTKPVAADDSGVEQEAFVRKLAPQVGLEPTTRALTVRCSTIELLRNRKVVALLYRRHAEFRQLCACLVGILEMDGLHPGVAGSLGVGGDVVEKNRAGGGQAGRAQCVLEDRGVGFQQANLVREHVRVEVLQKRVMLEDVVH